jgi:hypothetical protein
MLLNRSATIHYPLSTVHCYLQPIETAKDWDLITPDGGIYQLYYHPKHQHWEAYQFLRPIDRPPLGGALARSITASTILTIYEVKGSHTYR